MKAHATVKNKQIRFGSPIAEANFYEKAEGQHIIITLDDAPSSQKRRFFEGCLVQATFYAMPHSGWETFQDAREALKGEFLGVQKKDLKGKPYTHIPSTNSLSNRKFGELIEAVVAWLRENQMVPEECLDPENFTAWKNSAPSPGEVYPPLGRLKERYNIEKYGSKSGGADAGK